MKKLLLIILLTFTSLFFANPSFAEYTTIGGHECGQVLTGDKNNNKFVRNTVVDWFHGFLTGTNYALDKELVNKIPGSDSIYYAIVKYCKDNPLKTSQDAAKDIYWTLK